MNSKICLSCGDSFHPRAQQPTQTYCSKKACQRERRRLWQKLKRQLDPDYLDNQTRAQQSWVDRNPDYWREYRHQHPSYVDKNRAKQRLRNTKKRPDFIAKMDASTQKKSFPSGIYRLVILHEPEIAKMDSWTVKITLIEVESE